MAEPAARRRSRRRIRTSIRTSTTACCEAFKKETELFVGSTLREDRSVLELLRADYTFVNERLARHYGIPGIYGSRFRRVTLPNPDQRGGLLAQGALLATTSYPDRTSPVLRGKWLLEQHLRRAGAAAAAGRGHEPAGDEARRGAADDPRAAGAASQRIRCAAAVTRSIDPLGFALENFDAIGGWRTIDEVGQAGRRERQHGRAARRSTGSPGLRALLLESAGSVPAHGHREAAGLRARPAARVLRPAGGPEDRPRRGAPATIAGRRSFSAS